MGRLPVETPARAIVVDPEQPKRVYAANDSGVYRSDDAGQTWDIASQGIQDVDIAAITLDPSQPHRLFAMSKKGVLYTSDNGADSWRTVTGEGRVRE